jgi:hypothetical protein
MKVSELERNNSVQFSHGRSFTFQPQCAEFLQFIFEVSYDNDNSNMLYI